AVVLARGLAKAEDGAADRRVQRRLQRWANGKAGEWHQRLADLFRLEGHTVDGVSPWQGGVGYTVRVQMPEGTPELPSDAPRKLAAALRRPRGGGVEITDGMAHGEIQIRVTAVDVMAKELLYPGKTDVTSMNDPIVLGLHPDAVKAVMRLRDDCGLLVGQIGSGKSNTINVANAQALRTDDGVVWHIDITGAGISLPWLRAWALDGTAGVPLIDWSANTVEEAHIMLDVALAGIAARKVAYQDLMDDVNDDKIPISAQVPEILIVVDEVAELPKELLAKLDSVVDTGRAARVRTLLCGLRATLDVLTPAIKKQSRNRAGMRVTDPEELHHLFASGNGRLDPKTIPFPGCGYLSAPDENDADSPPTPFKAYRITRAQIKTLSPHLAARRPSIDGPFLDTAPGRFYASRWGRILPRLYPAKKLAAATTPYTELEVLRPKTDPDKGIPITTTDPAAPGEQAAVPAPATSLRKAADGSVVPDTAGRYGADALTALLNTDRTPTNTPAPDTGTAASSQEPPAGSSNVIRAQFGTVIRQTGGPTDRPNPVPQLLTDAHNAITAAGGRMHTADLADRLGMEATLLGTELGRLLREVGVERPGKGTVRAGADSESRYGYLAETLASAINRYANRDTE
ncbi:hypothetical protein ACFU99_17665, partial [Streptomyces sp. NPDC057654]|uniref:hypothetical protein n=1 Tax=Streptomyces sp. NPDC057654 TaxID=3346196 RepID=UPI0036C3E4EE